MQLIEKTEAIVLRVTPFSETSQIVTWLTPDRGRIATMIKGARRSKSPFLGQYDHFYTCELIYYNREHAGMHIARECCPLQTRDALRGNWRATAVASYAADLAARASMEGGRQHETYNLLRTLLDFLASGGHRVRFNENEPRPRIALVFWFELQLLNALGLAPHLYSCADCGARLLSGQPTHYSFQRNGLICGRCPTGENTSALLLKPDTLAMLNSWAATSDPQSAKNTIVSNEQRFALRALFDTLLEQLAGVSTVHRPLVEEVLMA